MAALILTMLLIGVAMVTSLANDHALVALHRPLQSHHCCNRRRAIETLEVQI
ncbi:hypothetical protein [Methylorubrum thiocyanatum]|uniref:hypothetical protein n=1 Tax=Methylorubrum thiocyanatum TaxID=47958 RepID=UPI00398C6B0D